MKKIRTGLMLFFNAFFISSFTFGGGFVIISMYKKKYVEQKKLLTDSEMMDIMTMSQSAPGPIAVNASLLIGYKMAGIVGAVMSMLGTIMPPIIILSIVSSLYSVINGNMVMMSIMHGMNAGISAIICDVVMSLTIVVKREKNYYALVTLPVTFALAFFTEINVFFIILPAFVLGIIITLVEKKLAEKKNQKLQLSNTKELGESNNLIEPIKDKTNIDSSIENQSQKSENKCTKSQEDEVKK